MSRTMKVFGMGLRQIAKDGMLLVLLPVPFLVGIVFRFAVPVISSILEEKFSVSLLPWYGLVDAMLLCFTPMVVAMVSAFLLLDERGEGVSAFYQITPVGGCYYLAARIFMPMLWSFGVTLLAAIMFQISAMPLAVMIAGTFVSTWTGGALAMMVVSVAQNRVEGLAVSKLMGIIFFGLFCVWLVPAPYCYFCAFLPTFWIGKIVLDGVTVGSLLLGLVSCAAWIFLFSRRFFSRIG